MSAPRFEDGLRERERAVNRQGAWILVRPEERDALAEAVQTLRLIGHDSADPRARKFATRAVARLDALDGAA